MSHRFGFPIVFTVAIAGAALAAARPCAAQCVALSPAQLALDPSYERGARFVVELPAR